MSIPRAELIPFPTNVMDVSFIRVDKSWDALCEEMEKLKKVVDQSFGELSNVQPGNKLFSRTSGTVGKPDFAVEIQIDSEADGISRTVWNIAASITNTVFLGMANLSGASIDQNISNLKKVVDHVLVIYESTLIALNSQIDSSAPIASMAIKGQIHQINLTMAKSLEGVRNLLKTYIIDRMPNVKLLVEKSNEEGSKIKVGEMVDKIADCLENIFKLESDTDFHLYHLHKLRQTTTKEDELELLGKFSDGERIGNVVTELEWELKTFFPDNEAHVNQLRSIGKLVKRIRRIKSYIKPANSAEMALKNVAENFRQIDGVEREDGSILYPDGSCWKKSARLYYKNDTQQSATSATKFVRN